MGKTSHALFFKALNLLFHTWVDFLPHRCRLTTVIPGTQVIVCPKIVEAVCEQEVLWLVFSPLWQRFSRQ